MTGTVTMSRARYRRMCLMLRMYRMSVRGCPHPGNGKAWNSWQRRWKLLQAVAVRETL
jgi:hypothetical protein